MCKVTHPVSTQASSGTQAAWSHPDLFTNPISPASPLFRDGNFDPATAGDLSPKFNQKVQDRTGPRIQTNQLPAHCYFFPTMILNPVSQTGVNCSCKCPSEPREQSRVRKSHSLLCIKRVATWPHLTLRCAGETDPNAEGCRLSARVRRSTGTRGTPSELPSPCTKMLETTEELTNPVIQSQVQDGKSRDYSDD